MYIPKFRKCTTSILSPTAFTDQDGLIIPSRSIKKIATVCAEDKRADRRHRGKQVGGICLDLNLNFNSISQITDLHNRTKIILRALTANFLSLVSTLTQ